MMHGQRTPPPKKEYAVVDAILPFSARSDVYPAADESPAAGNG